VGRLEARALNLGKFWLLMCFCEVVSGLCVTVQNWACAAVPLSSTFARLKRGLIVI
jgi:hypothetical protein